MSKRCPDCGWPYLEDTEYIRHLIKGHCKMMTNSGGMNPLPDTPELRAKYEQEFGEQASGGKEYSYQDLAATSPRYPEQDFANEPEPPHTYRNNGLGADVCTNCGHIRTVPDSPATCQPEPPQGELEHKFQSCDWCGEWQKMAAGEKTCYYCLERAETYYQRGREDELKRLVHEDGSLSKLVVKHLDELRAHPNTTGDK